MSLPLILFISGSALLGLWAGFLAFSHPTENVVDDVADGDWPAVPRAFSDRTITNFYHAEGNTP